jgi:hypothetical protein
MKKKKMSSPNSISIEKFVEAYSSALLAYAYGSHPGGEAHVVDLAVTASSFAEASFYLLDHMF